MNVDLIIIKNNFLHVFFFFFPYGNTKNIKEFTKFYVSVSFINNNCYI